MMGCQQVAAVKLKTFHIGEVEVTAKHKCCEKKKRNKQQQEEKPKDVAAA